MLEDFQTLAQGHSTEIWRTLEEFEDEHIQLTFALETYKKECLHVNKDERKDKDTVNDRLQTPPLEPETQSEGLKITDNTSLEEKQATMEIELEEVVLEEPQPLASQPPHLSSP